MTVKYDPPEEFAGHTLHRCVDKGRGGVGFEPPMHLNLKGMKVWDEQTGKFVEADPANPIEKIFVPGALIALCVQRKAGAA